MRCVSCGEDEAIEAGLCRKCYSENHPLSLHDDELTLCKVCGASHVGEWTDEAALDRYVRSILKGVRIVESFGKAEHDQATYTIRESENSYTIHVKKARAIPGKEPLIQEGTLLLKKKYTVCPTCQRKKSGYFEAVFQVRREEGTLSPKERESVEEAVASLVEKESDPHAFIARARDLREGIDFEVGGKKVARRLAASLRKMFGGTLVESNKVMGRDSRKGKDILRLTITLRLPSLRKGEHVMLDGAVFRVVEVSQIVRLATLTQQKAIPSDKISDLKKRGALARVEEPPERVIVTSLLPEEVEILREDYTTCRFPRPQNLRMRVGDEYEAFIQDGDIFWVSNDGHREKD